MYLINGFMYIIIIYSTLLVSSKFSVTSVADRIETAGSRFNKMVETLRLTIVKEGLEDKSEKKSLLTRFVMMPKIPYSIPFDMITMAGNNDISKIYMTGDSLDDFIEKNDIKLGLAKKQLFWIKTPSRAFSHCIGYHDLPQKIRSLAQFSRSAQLT